MHFVAFLTRLGRYDDDTAGSGSTVDTGRTCVLQYGDGLYVIGVERTAHHTVHHVAGFAACGDRTCTADTDLGSIARLTGCVGNSQTCYLTLQHVTDVTGRYVGQLLCVHSHNGRGKFGFLHCRITQGDNLLKTDSIRLHDDTHFLNSSQLNRFVADVGDLES